MNTDFFKKFGLTQSEFEEKEKLVFKVSLEKITDLTNSLESLKNNPELIKSRLVFVMVIADVFARLMMVFEGREQNAPFSFYRNMINKLLIRFIINKNGFQNRKRFEEWLGRYAFNNANRDYLEEKRRINYGVKIVWKLRNSLLHFYGLPPSKITLVDGNLPDYQLREFKKAGIIVINTLILEKVIRSGPLVQLEQMKDTLKRNPEFYVNGILRMHSVINNEGTLKIPLKKTN